MAMGTKSNTQNLSVTAQAFTWNPQCRRKGYAKNFALEILPAERGSQTLPWCWYFTWLSCQ